MISRHSVGYFWYFPNNVVLTITFTLNFLPFVYVRFSKLRRCSTSAVIFPLNCVSTLKKVCKKWPYGEPLFILSVSSVLNYQSKRGFALYQNGNLGPTLKKFFFFLLLLIPRDIAAIG